MIGLGYLIICFCVCGIYIVGWYDCTKANGGQRSEGVGDTNGIVFYSLFVGIAAIITFC